jgi:dTDP-glucose 4,6-dehydratase
MFPEKLIPLAITNLLENKKVPIYGKGDQVRDWLYVTDHARAVDLVLNKGKVGETYCVGGMTTEITNLEVIKTICKLLDKNPEENIEYVKDRAGHDFKYKIDWTKINKELGWQPAHNLEQSLKQTVEWYRANTEWWQRVKSGAYKDYYQKQYENR